MYRFLLIFCFVLFCVTVKPFNFFIDFLLEKNSYFLGFIFNNMLHSNFDLFDTLYYNVTVSSLFIDFLIFSDLIINYDFYRQIFCKYNIPFLADAIYLEELADLDVFEWYNAAQNIFNFYENSSNNIFNLAEFNDLTLKFKVLYRYFFLNSRRLLYDVLNLYKASSPYYNFKKNASNFLIQERFFVKNLLCLTHLRRAFITFLVMHPEQKFEEYIPWIPVNPKSVFLSSWLSYSFNNFYIGEDFFFSISDPNFLFYNFWRIFMQDFSIRPTKLKKFGDVLNVSRYLIIANRKLEWEFDISQRLPYFNIFLFDLTFFFFIEMPFNEGMNLDQSLLWTRLKGPIWLLNPYSFFQFNDSIIPKSRFLCKTSFWPPEHRVRIKNTILKDYDNVHRLKYLFSKIRKISINIFKNKVNILFSDFNFFAFNEKGFLNDTYLTNFRRRRFRRYLRKYLRVWVRRERTSSAMSDIKYCWIYHY